MAHEEQLIQHLSKEIETLTNNMMAFRTRIVLTVFLGPFGLLGYVITAMKGSSISLKMDFVTSIALIQTIWSLMSIVLILSYIEEHVWDQCNKWRRIIAELQNEPSPPIDINDFIFRHKLRLAYITTYTFITVLFFSILLLIVRLVGSQHPN